MPRHRPSGSAPPAAAAPRWAPPSGGPGPSRPPRAPRLGRDSSGGCAPLPARPPPHVRGRPGRTRALRSSRAHRRGGTPARCRRWAGPTRLSPSVKAQRRHRGPAPADRSLAILRHHRPIALQARDLQTPFGVRLQLEPEVPRLYGADLRQGRADAGDGPRPIRVPNAECLEQPVVEASLVEPALPDAPAALPVKEDEEPLRQRGLPLPAQRAPRIAVVLPEAQLLVDELADLQHHGRVLGRPSPQPVLR